MRIRIRNTGINVRNGCSARKFALDNFFTRFYLCARVPKKRLRQYLSWYFCRLAWGGSASELTSGRARQVTWAKRYQGIYCLALGTQFPGPTCLMSQIIVSLPCGNFSSSKKNPFVSFPTNFPQVYICSDGHSVSDIPPCKKMPDYSYFSRLTITHILL